MFGWTFRFFITTANDDDKHLDLPSIKVLHEITFSIHGICYSWDLWNSTKHRKFTV